jgi:hypothetical protein
MEDWRVFSLQYKIYDCVGELSTTANYVPAKFLQLSLLFDQAFSVVNELDNFVKEWIIV